MFGMTWSEESRGVTPLNQSIPVILNTHHVFPNNALRRPEERTTSSRGTRGTSSPWHTRE